MDGDFDVDFKPFLDYISPENLNKQLKNCGVFTGNDQLGFEPFIKLLNKAIDKMRTLLQTETDHLEATWMDANGCLDQMEYLGSIVTNYKTRMRKLEKLRNELQRVRKEVLLLKLDTTELYTQAKVLAEKIRQKIVMQNITVEALNRFVTRHTNLMSKIKSNLVKLNTYKLKYSQDYLDSTMETFSAERPKNSTLLRMEAELRKRTLKELAKNAERFNNMALPILEPIRTLNTFDLGTQSASTRSTIVIDNSDDDDNIL
ncbi:unnamed protein product [Parnassius apollo]|uniref:(apollo) hypothetical protein n=1 Tax=Parnassius apollo TaxID=110799 RepID=A0A8S3X8S3_PARAO|nr:unnamed protein product [Parnassius apollo]